MIKNSCQIQMFWWHVHTELTWTTHCDYALMRINAGCSPQVQLCLGVLQLLSGGPAAALHPCRAGEQCCQLIAIKWHTTMHVRQEEAGCRVAMWQMPTFCLAPFW